MWLATWSRHAAGRRGSAIALALLRNSDIFVFRSSHDLHSPHCQNCRPLLPKEYLLTQGLQVYMPEFGQYKHIRSALQNLRGSHGRDCAGYGMDAVQVGVALTMVVCATTY